MPILSDLLVTAAGAFTSIVTALILFGLERAFGFSFYTWSLWFVIPVGAIFSGLAAASGYYFGAKLFNRKPTKLVLMYMVLISTGTFFLIHYLNYVFIEVNGKMVKDYLPFFDYLSLSIQSTSFKFYSRAGSGSTGALGAAGFIFAGLQILGFSLGGLATYAILAEQPFCDGCASFLNKSYSKRRYHFPSEEYSQVASKLIELIKTDRPEEALSEYNKSGRDKETQGYNHQTHMEIRDCKNCHRSWIRLSFYKQDSNSWSEFRNLKTSIYYKRPIHVPPNM